MDAPNCSAVMLELPPLRGGCAADARYALEQRAGGGAWARVRDAPMPSHASEGGAGDSWVAAGGASAECRSRSRAARADKYDWCTTSIPWLRWRA